MADKRNFAALDWVITEIDETLKDARQALEAYVEDTKDSTRIRFCLTHIHQVHGSLQMVEFHGASLLAEEMEHLAQALMEGKVTSAPEAQEVLMRSLLQLPSYLEHVKSQKEDNPGVVLPLLNDLRAVRNQSYLSETNLFSPNLQLVKELYGSRHPITQDKAKLAQVLKKLREMYQFAAASVLRGIKVEENLNYLDKVFSRMEALTQGTACYPLWEISAALVEGLLRDDIELSVAVRGLLRHLARELRVLGENAPGALDFMPRESLLKNLLYYITRAEGGGKKVNRVKQRYQLAEALLDGVIIGDDGEGDTLSAPDPEAIRSVVVALSDEINSIKHVLDLSVSGHGEPEDLKEVLPIVKRVADTLAVLGIGELRKKVNQQAEVLEELSQQNSFDEARLLDVAGKIVEIEHRLEAISKVVGTNRDLSSVDEREIEIDQAKVTVIKECQHGLEQAKDAIVEYISSKWDRSHLLNVGSLLHDIRGGLDMIPLARPAAILESCAAYIQHELLEKEEQPSWQALDTLADAIASVEYFLERLLGDMEEETDSLLDVAESSVASLGYPMSPPGSTASSAPQSPQPHIDEPADTADNVVPLTQEAGAGDATLIAAPEEAANAEQDLLPQESAEEDFVLEEPILAEPEPLVKEPLLTAAVSLSLDSISVDEDGEESDIDDEIIEIFIEEAGEVKETLEEYHPQWKANQQDQDSLVVVRRAFHTLKGSGRMVEAFDIGELAWSVENMLNRVIDRTVRVDLAHAHIIELVLHLLPELISAFANKKANPQKALSEQYMAWAHAMSEGNIPDELAGVPDGESVPKPDLSAASAPAGGADEAREQAATVEHAEQPVAANEAYEAGLDEETLVLWDIFSSEAKSHLATMEAFIAQMEADAPIYSPPSDDFQRALHTLKGSAKMAQVTPIAAMAEPLEAFAKELVSYQVDINNDILQLYRDAVAYTREALDQIAARQPVEIARLSQFLAREAELRELAVGHLIRLKEQQQNVQNQVDPRLLSIFMAEEMNLLLDADQLIEGWQNTGSNDGNLEPVMQELSTLEAGAQQANLPDMAGLSAQLRTLYQQSQNGQQEINEDFFSLLGAGHNALLDMIDAVAAGQNVAPPPEEITSALASLIHSGTLLPEIQLDVQAAETETLVDAAANDFEPADETDSEFELIEEPELEAVASGVDFELVEEPADGLIEPMELEGEHSFDNLSPEQAGLEQIDIDSFGQNVDQGFELVEELADDSADFGLEILGTEDLGAEELLTHDDSADEAVDEQFDVEQAVHAESVTEQELLVEDLPQQDHVSDASEQASSVHEPLETEQESLSAGTFEQVQEEPHQPQTPDTQEAEPQRGEAIAGLLDTIDVNDPDFDEDIIEVFLEEADELIEELDEAVHSWETDWVNVENPEQIKRVLHTLKGGARLSGMANLGELTHEYESFLIASDLNDVDDAFFERMHDYQDKVLSGVRAIQAYMAGDASAPQEPQPEPSAAQVAEPASEPGAMPEAPEPQTETNVLPFAPKPRDPGAEPGQFTMPEVKPGNGQQQTAVRKHAGPQEVVKVNADLLEELVNLAGETSISRARIEQQVSDFGQALDDIDSTISRLQEQLRRLDIETEAQVIFRQEQMAAHEEFDPLEMDRYSQLQQLSRSLIESASDLVDLRQTLTDNIRDTETLLLQQSRINTTLQEGLMRSRMVPFSRLVPRLRRIVRQVSAELGKNVSFELDNVEGELDRSVLERMVAPLEHMLRNAVDHGIELPDRRIELGKPESGRVVLTLAREGGDVILRLADDGRGVDLRRVREKAVERGLMSADAELSDFDVMQFVLHAGFSTAETVTQISGRGVGMDVVSSEIKAIGGSVLINSEWGKGTEIVVRLPFTVSVNRALMVEMGPDLYAIPLNTIEGIVRVSPFELEHYYANTEARFEYAGDNYQVRYLGTMLNAESKPKLEGQSLPMPVLLVRSAENTMAIHVDNLLGSREVVVKSLGTQFSAVQGLSGATLMGDGSVVVILDPHALVRKDVALAKVIEMHPRTMLPEVEVPEVVTKTVMVVDDSVTVRKVTSRFLEREGFNVITAKDGVDALRILQDDIPDLMLLDIEMPRMDGFEVAKNIRTTSRWKHIPIIMITSRTGEKHRERAMDLGVNKYLGKPYQEDLLLESMNELFEQAD
ncbi:chemosensory pili system protein ChpA (sensor histidine kinase/response regulator) [Alteromonadaceae bacterium Bs31]|nr:chemosensory pili system protein ChpA (sensor histidine kinase/response regulator) [Alteromonadaceae bacterium Bs31]